MGLYNELIVEDPDLGKFDIQFKFGELWLYKYKIGDCPNAEKLSKETLNLPTHINISIEDAQRIVNFLKKWK